jgi:phenylalanine-4-hydroxylase
MIEMNPILEKLPKHLMSLVIDQPYNEYTAQDHAVWRYVMRQNVRYLSEVAHGSYLDGLKKTGISIDSIPHMYGMNRILKEIGWAAVAVDGFIPPAAFMEFQAYNVLVIAADIRPIDQIEYTPAPDIIHEAAGHAPIIADPEYAEYLSRFGWIGCRAFSSARDYELYEAIRHLSILKADPYTSKEKIAEAEERLDDKESNLGLPSEMAKIRNLHWWTVEYGLIGNIKKPKIYGAGLLSSIGESYSSLQPEVKKLPYTIEAADINFDITTRQPQLFVTPDFLHLIEVLEEFADNMALRTGGLDGLLKAIDSDHTATSVYSSGLQVTGTFTEVIVHRDAPVYIRTSGPTTLNFDDKQLDGHGKEYHSEGFGSPIGKLTNSDNPLENLSDGELEQLNIRIGANSVLEFKSEVKVMGRVEKLLRKEGKLLIISFSGCKVTFRDRVLFEPSWGLFDMAVGEEIISVFSGPADPDNFGLIYPVPEEKTHKIYHSERAKELHALYQMLRNSREDGKDETELTKIWERIRNDYGEDWLLPLEIAEVLQKRNENPVLKSEILNYLLSEKSMDPGIKRLIENGLMILDS